MDYKQRLIERLEQTLDWAQEGAAVGADFVAEQTPLYIQEMLAWLFWYHVSVAAAWALIMFVVTKVLLSSLRKCFTRLKGTPRSSDAEFGYEVGVVASIIGIVGTNIAGIICVFVYGLYALKVYIAPRVVVLDELSKLIGGLT